MGGKTLQPFDASTFQLFTMDNRTTLTAPSDGSRLWNTVWKVAHRARSLICQLQIEGRHYIPEKGGAIIASNHTVGPDFLVLAYASPRQIYFMAKIEAFQIHPLITKILNTAGVFPIRRGEKDTSAISEAVQGVQSGHIVGMFPEGTRSVTGALGRGKSGVTRIAMAANAPVIPAVVIGADQILPKIWRPVRRPEVTVRFGPPIHIPDESHNLASIKQQTNIVMQGIAALLPAELRGSYQRTNDTNVV